MATSIIDDEDNVVNIDSDDDYETEKQPREVSDILNGVAALTDLADNCDGDPPKPNPLLQRLLDLPNPVITNQVIEFLLQPNICKELVKYITRMRDAPRVAEEIRDEKDMVAVRRSHQAMIILSRNSNPINRVISEKWEEIVTELLRIFEPSSDGVLTHISPVWKQTLHVSPTETLHHLLANPGILQTLIGLSDERVPCDCIVEIIGCNSESSVKHLVIEQLGDLELISTLIGKCVDKDEDKSSEALSGLEKVLEEAGKGHAYYKIFGSAETVSCGVSDLVNVVVSTSTANHQKQHAVQALQALYTRWRQITEQDTETPHVEDTMYPCLEQHIADLCISVVNFSGRRLMQQHIEFSGYTVNNSITTLFLDTNALIYYILTQDDSVQPTVEILEIIPASYWKNISTSFFSHEHCSIFHILYYRFVNIVIKSDDISTFKNFFSKTKLISRLVDELSGEPSGKFAIVLLVCNLLRLKAESDAPISYLRNLLSSNPKWVAFQERLRKLSSERLVGSGVEFDGPAGPSFVHYGPRLVRQDSISSLLDEHNTYFSESDSDVLGFGSKFSHYVGMGELTPYEEPEHPIVPDTFSDAALIAGGTGNQNNSEGPAKKKTNKKKKKKGNATTGA